jgi:hypothetical protein
MTAVRFYRVERLAASGVWATRSAHRYYEDALAHALCLSRICHGMRVVEMCDDVPMGVVFEVVEQPQNAAGRVRE